MARSASEEGDARALVIKGEVMCQMMNINNRSNYSASKEGRRGEPRKR